MRVQSAGVAAVMAAALLAGCGSSNDKATTAQSSTGGQTTKSADKAANVAWITYSYLDYQQAEEAGLKAGVKPAGGSVKVFNANFDPQKLQQQCQDAVTSGRYNAIVLTPVDPTTGIACVKIAKAANIPVISLEGVVGKNPDDLNPQVDGVVGSIATAPTQGAKDTAKFVTEACAGKDPCKVIVDTPPSDPFGTVVLKYVSAVPGVKIIQKINTQYDPSLMQKTAPDTFTTHPDTNVLVTLSDQQALAAIPAAKAQGLLGKIRLLAAGGSRQGAQAVANGELFGTLATWPFQSGKIAGEMAIKAVNGQPINPAGVNGQLIDKPEFVTKATVSQFKPEWGPAAK